MLNIMEVLVNLLIWNKSRTVAMKMKWMNRPRSHFSPVYQKQLSDVSKFYLKQNITQKSFSQQLNQTEHNKKTTKINRRFRKAFISLFHCWNCLVISLCMENSHKLIKLWYNCMHLPWSHSGTRSRFHCNDCLLLNYHFHRTCPAKKIWAEILYAVPSSGIWVKFGFVNHFL